MAKKSRPNECLTICKNRDTVLVAQDSGLKVNKAAPQHWTN